VNEGDFLARVAARLGRAAPLLEPPAYENAGVPDIWKEYRLSQEERVTMFRREWEKLGGQCECFADVESLRRGLSELLSFLAPSRVGLWGGHTLVPYHLEPVLAPYTAVGWEPREKTGENVVRSERIGLFAAADVGITGADYAIADTGTVVLFSGPDKGRSVSLLPRVHIAIIPASRIWTRMGDVLEEIARHGTDPQRMPASIQWITGPSRSSDIENDLTIGVHGPIAVYALIVKNGGGESSG
jgi:L-lactate dehydrogenase complex protein LldG